MNITIHRGQNQIGGSVIEVSTQKSRIFLDAGMTLDEDKPHPLDIPGLFNGSADCDAILISHYHPDHVGLVSCALPEIPVCMGKSAYDIYQFTQGYFGHSVRNARCFFEHGKSFEIGDIRITPYLCDHSAFDSYMIQLESGSESILYTGDYRSHGFMDFDRLLQALPKSVDLLITEGTTLSRSDDYMQTENDIQTIAEDAMRSHTGPILILAPATNITRLVAMFKATIHCKRIFAYDTYAAQVALRTKNSIPNPDTFDPEFLRVFITNPQKESEYEFLARYPRHKIGRKALISRPFAAMIRSSMFVWVSKMANEIKEITHKDLPFENGLLIYSMWDGYKSKEDRSGKNLRRLLDFAQSMGMEIMNIHTSGHADAQAITKLIEAVKPRYILPVHTENAQWFADKYGTDNVIQSRSFDLHSS
jgi:ribonuclease J